MAYKLNTNGFDSFYVYLKLEPLTLINGIQHIALFECTDDNIKRLIDVFREAIQNLFELSNKDELTDLSNWQVHRVDYAYDARMNNPDEVTAFINLCKWSVMENSYNEKAYNSYGDRKQYFLKAQACFRDKSLEEMQEIIDMYIEKIIVYEDEIEVILNLVPLCYP